MKLGKPQDFHDGKDVRLRAIERAIAQYKFTCQELKKPFAEKLDEHTKLFLKGFGNEVNLLSAFREIIFNSRELLDLLLLQINKITSQTPKDFLPFAKQMVKGGLDKYNLQITAFLKTNFTYIFNIRKIRSQIKNNPANVEFNFNTNHFEARCTIPIDKDEMNMLNSIDMLNRDQAIQNKSYSHTCNLDIFFPEVLKFWDVAFSILDKDLQKGISKNGMEGI